MNLFETNFLSAIKCHYQSVESWKIIDRRKALLCSIDLITQKKCSFDATKLEYFTIGTHSVAQELVL